MVELSSASDRIPDQARSLVRGRDAGSSKLFNVLRLGQVGVVTSFYSTDPSRSTLTGLHRGLIEHLLSRRSGLLLRCRG